MHCPAAPGPPPAQAVPEISMEESLFFRFALDHPLLHTAILVIDAEVP